MIDNFTVRVISDIHTEMYNTDQMRHLIKKMSGYEWVDLLILAGDIGVPLHMSSTMFVKPVLTTSTIIEKIDKDNIPVDDVYESLNQFLYQCTSIAHTIVYVAGNHEFYRGTIESTQSQLKILCHKYNIRYLNRDSFYYKGYKIIGCTLWGEPSPDAHKYLHTIKDFEKIKDMTIDRYSDLHNRDKDFLKENLKSSLKNSLKSSLKEDKICPDKDIPVIVITHHLPSYSLIDEEFRGNPNNQFYASPMDEYIKRARYWFYGHTHRYKSVKIGDCKCYVNPVGYTHETSGHLDEIITICSLDV